MTVDPRWIYGVPGTNIAEQVALQLGADDESGAEVDWARLREGAVQIIAEELADGACLVALFMVQEADGNIALARASARFDAELVAGVGDLYEEALVEHRDEQFRASLQLIETRIGVALQVQRLLVIGEQTLDYHGYLIPSPDGGLVVECVSSPSGWSGLWGPSLESMVLSLDRSDEVPDGRIELVAFVLDGERR